MRISRHNKKSANFPPEPKTDTTAQLARQTTVSIFSGRNRQKWKFLATTKKLPISRQNQKLIQQYNPPDRQLYLFFPVVIARTAHPTDRQRVKKACKFWCLPLSPAFNKAKLYHLRPKILATKWRMDIDRDGYWKPHVSNFSALSVPKISKAVAAQKNKLKIESKRVLGCTKIHTSASGS